MKEAALSQLIIRDLKYRGKLAVKMSDRFHAGIPDIYVSGGIWIEVKTVPFKKYFSPLKLLRPDQHRWMQNLKDHADKVYIFVGGIHKLGMHYYCALYDADDAEWVTPDKCCRDLGLCLSFNID